MPLKCNSRALWILAPALGCGGGAPLLHGAHPLREGEAQGGVGLSATVASGAARRAIAELASDAASGTPPTPARARAAAASGAFAAGVAPWVGARIGLGSGNEVGLSYSGRAARLDGRHVLQQGAFALSIGAGASVLLASRDDTGNPDRWSLSRTSLGCDVPLLLGWRSTAGIVSLYGGPRVGFERLAGSVALGPADGDAPRDVALGHWYGGALIGLTLGFRHLHGALELQATYHRVDGDVADVDVGLGGVTWTPAAGLVATF